MSATRMLLQLHRELISMPPQQLRQTLWQLDRVMVDSARALSTERRGLSPQCGALIYLDHAHICNTERSRDS